MRPVLAAVLVLLASVPLGLPSAAACHPDASPASPVDGTYLVLGAGPSGCPHRAVACVEVWRESNGIAGLQRDGPTPDAREAGFCPLP